MTGVTAGAAAGALRNSAIASSSFLRWPNDDGDANLVEIVAGQPAQQLPIDVVGAERLGIMGKTDRAEQIT